MKKAVLLTLLIHLIGLLPLRGLGGFALQAQPTHPPLDSTALANAREYESIEEALQADKDEVYKLKLKWVEELPVEVFLFRNLQVLNFSFNQLTSLPAAIGELKNLTTLYCSYNELASLPEAIVELKSLTYLFCQGNQLTNLPATIGDLKSLKELHCNNNQLSSLPTTIGELKSLKELYCHKNQLRSLPATIGGLKNLTYLFCQENQLSNLPATIGELKSLEYLYCNNNQLSSLPATIGELKSLKNLDCNSNRLTSLPETIGALESLTSLYCYLNKLTSLPASLGELKNLTYVYYYSNQFTSLPNELKNKFDFIVNSMEWDISNLYINQNGDKLYLDFRQYYALDKLNLMRVDVYGAWWHNQKGNYPQAKAIIQDIFATLKKYEHTDSTEAKETNKDRLTTIENNAKSIAQSIEKGISLLSAKKQAEIQSQVAEEKEKLAKEKTKEAQKAKKDADKERNQAQRDKAKAEKAEKEANKAKKEATNLNFRITVIGVGVLVIVLLFLAYFIASQRKAKAQARLIALKQQETEEQNQELNVLAEELRQQSETVQEQRDDLMEKNNEMEALTEELRQQNDIVNEQRDDLIEKNNEMEALAEELRQQAEALEATNAEIQAMQQTKDLMISAVNHDLRNPLNPILNYSKAGYQGDKDERLAIIHDRAKMMFSLIGDIMDVYRADKLTVTPAVSSAFKAASEAIHVITDAKTDLPAIVNEVPEGLEGLFEYKYIERVLENILSNAVKYSDKAEEGGKVIVSAKIIEAKEAVLKRSLQALEGGTNIAPPSGAGGLFIRFSVADNGMGIPKEQFEAIFEPFTNPNARSIGSAKSVGIGLTFCKTIVEAHGSVIQIASTVGEGTTFSFDLPYAAPKVVETKQEVTQETLVSFEALTADERAGLADIIALLETLDLCTSEMEEAIQSINAQGNANIDAWKHALAQANDDYDEEAFKGLLQ